MDAFEIAETTTDPELQKAALTFVVIGAGPTGVEMAGSISELAKRSVVADFRNIHTQQARLVLLDAAPKVLPMYSDALCASALRQLKTLEIEVKVGTKVLGVTHDGVQLENELVRARTVVWAAGNAASPQKNWAAKPTGRVERLSLRISVFRTMKCLSSVTLPIFRIRTENRFQGLLLLPCKLRNTLLATSSQAFRANRAKEGHRLMPEDIL